MGADLELLDRPPRQRRTHDRRLGRPRPGSPTSIPTTTTTRWPAEVAELRHRVASATAILFSTPEYAGAMPGSLKNLLDWTVGGVEISDKPTAWINISTAPAGAAGTHESLTIVLRYTGAKLVEAACVPIPVHRDAVGLDGLIGDPEIRIRTKAAVTTLLDAT